MDELKASFIELGERFRRRSPLSRVAFGGLLGFAVAAPFSISLAQICVFAAMGAWLASLGARERAPLRTQRFPLWRPWLLFAVLTLASAFHSPDALKGLAESRELSQILIFYLALNVVEDDREALWLAKALFLATGAAALWTLGVSLRLPWSLGSRASGFFSIYMTLGGFMLVVGVLAFSWLFTAARGWRDAWLGVLALLIVAALISTMSRNAWVGLAVGMAVIVAASRSGKAALVLAAMIAAMIFIAPDSVRRRVKSIIDTRDATVVERLYMWKSGVRMWMDRKLLGFGPGQIKAHYGRYANPGAAKKSTGHLHNNVVHLAAERGILALGAWVWAWVGYFILVIRRMRRAARAPCETRFRMVGGLAAAAAFLSAGMFEYNFGDSEVVMTAFLAVALPFTGGTSEASPE